MQNYLTKDKIELFAIILYIIVAIVLAIYIIIADSRKNSFQNPSNPMETTGKVFCIGLFWPIYLIVTAVEYFWYKITDRLI